MPTKRKNAAQVKHLALTKELTEDIIETVSADKIVIVCLDAEKDVIETLLKQLGWSQRIQGIITINDLDKWYSICLSKKYRRTIGAQLLRGASREFATEFPSNKEIDPFIKRRSYDKIVMPADWKESTPNSTSIG